MEGVTDGVSQNSTEQRHEPVERMETSGKADSLARYAIVNARTAPDQPANEDPLALRRRDTGIIHLCCQIFDSRIYDGTIVFSTGTVNDDRASAPDLRGSIASAFDPASHIYYHLVVDIR